MKRKYLTQQAEWIDLKDSPDVLRMEQPIFENLTLELTPILERRTTHGT